MIDKKKIVIDNYFKSDCNFDTTIREAYRRGFERALQKLDACKNGNATEKQKLLKRLSEILPDDADITFCTVTWWDDDGCHNVEIDNADREWKTELG